MVEIVTVVVIAVALACAMRAIEQRAIVVEPAQDQVAFDIPLSDRSDAEIAMYSVETEVER